MNFTREPIIETIITPKEGHKLIIRNTKGSDGEEYIVDSIEVVSFGHSFFFRSLERPKSFLVPISDYEVVETKETRVVLKNATFERAIKIGGGRDKAVAKEKPAESEEQEPVVVEQRLEKKRERRRHRRRRSGASSEENKSVEELPPEQEKGAKGNAAEEQPKAPPPVISRLIPPPPTLISEKMSKEKKPLPETLEKVNPLEGTEEEQKAKKTPSQKKGENEVESQETEGSDMQRLATEAVETVSSTSFSSLEEKKTSFFGKFW